jgi:hypothetical protein
MEQILAVVKWFTVSGIPMLSALDAVLLALVAFFVLVPGDQPEAFLKGIADFIEKFSRKKAE